MKFELKKIKHHKSMSEETNCYEAVVFIDGVPSVAVSNRGFGGCDEQRILATSKHTEKEIQDYIDKNYPPIVSNLPDPKDPEKLFSYKPDLETICGKLFQQWEWEQELKKLLRSKILFQTPDAPKEIYVSSYKGVRKLIPWHLENFKKEEPNATLLNLIPFPKALEIYIKTCEG